ncbi:MAG: VapC toxin family PIN domain ribonuclease [Deltaproteobacteria bacterium]|nr:MAG: VapC toxin family PIN domain ribonuclease [Deltaproteobacteria bacterium]RLC09406.1 MAG: VapC toxin family PIN domain ribonuclease [Deltaproteobacteria bacterium]
MYMLDTNICIYVLQNRSKNLRHRFKVTKYLCISSVTYAELCFGIENGTPSLKDARWEQLDVFIRCLHVEALDWNAGRHYGRLRAWLKEQGKPIGNNDLFIASHAQSMGAVLVTNNMKEFSRVPDLTVENWV